MKDRVSTSSGELVGREGATRIGPKSALRASNKASNGKSFFYDELVAVVPRAGRAESSRFA